MHPEGSHDSDYKKFAALIKKHCKDNSVDQESRKKVNLAKTKDHSSK